MADEYIQDSSGGTLGGIVGANVSWAAYHRLRQQQFAYKYGPILPGKNKYVYGAKQWLGYTATRDEMIAWNNPWNRKDLFAGGTFAKANYMISRPVLGAQMIVNPSRYSASTVFTGMKRANISSRWGINVAGSMGEKEIGAWLGESFLKYEGKVASTGLRGAYNKGLYSFLGGSIDNVAEKAGAKMALEKIAAEGAEKVGLKVAGTAASHAVGYLAPAVGLALAAYDIATLSYIGFTGVAKIGEAVHYKIPKSYFQKSMKHVMRNRFEGLGPATAMSPDNMNNRMRAVQAIQGSRLNARSALGSEAGLLSGHFG